MCRTDDSTNQLDLDSYSVNNLQEQSMSIMSQHCHIEDIKEVQGTSMLQLLVEIDYELFGIVIVTFEFVPVIFVILSNMVIIVRLVWCN